MPLENSVYVLFVHGLWKVVIAGMFFTSFSKNIKNLCAHRFMSLFVVGVVLTFFHSLFSSITERLETNQNTDRQIQMAKLLK